MRHFVIFALAAMVPSIALGKRKVFDAPESAVQDPVSKYIYVSNVGGAPDAKDGNGFISRLKPDGAVIEPKVFPLFGDAPLNAPKGLAMTPGILWVSDIDRVVGYDLVKKKRTKEYSLAKFGVRFANDLLVQEHTMYVSDTAGDQIITIDLTKDGDAALELYMKGATGGANGLALDHANGDLLVAASPPDFKTPARAWRVHLPDGKPFHMLSQLPFEPAIGDGIAEHEGNIYMSDWATGSIYKSSKGEKPTVVMSGLKGPADFSLTTDGKAIIVVDMVEATVTVKPLP